MRRADLISSQLSTEPSSPSSSLEGRFQQQFTSSRHFASLDGKTENEPLDQPPTRTVEAAAQDEDEYEFRLFAKPLDPTKPTPNTRIVVRSPSPTQGEPSLINPRRLDAYYFTGDTSEVLMEQYRRSAVTGEHITKGLITRWVCSILQKGSFTGLTSPLAWMRVTMASYNYQSG